MGDKAFEFDWDAGNREKCRKHGVSAEEIEGLFHSGARIAPDVKHSAVESRHIAIGTNQKGRALFVAFAYRIVGGSIKIRPISAKYMHRDERERYEESS